MIDRMKVISLDRTPERFRRFQMLNPDIAAERVPAVDGMSLVRAELVRSGLITEQNSYSPGALGTLASHIALWRDCAAGGTPVQIAEDDMILRSDFLATSNAMLGALACWDIVLWQHNFDWPVMVRLPDTIGPVVLQYDPATHDKSWSQFRQGRLQPILLRLIAAAGTGCYALSPHGAAALLAACLPVGAEPAHYAPNPDNTWANSGLDVEVCRHYATLDAYFALPPLAVSPNDRSASTIRGHLAAIHDPNVANG